MKSRKKQEAGVEPTLPVTPMLDMTFQLLTFFIFTYHPTALEGKMDFSLPASGELKAEKQEDVDPTKSDTEVALESDLTVEVRAVKEGATAGNISNIVVKTREGESPVNNLDGLFQYLVKARESLVEQNNIKIACESKLKYAYVIEVMDTCMKADFKNVGFAPPPDLATAGN